MSQRLHRFPTWLILAGYLLAGTVAPWLHQRTHDHRPALPSEPAQASAPAPHEGHRTCRHAAVDTAAAHCADGHSHSHPSAPGPPHDDDDCFVCQVLAAQQRPVEPVEVVTAGEAVEPAAVQPVAAPDAPLLSGPLPRGPPCTTV